MLAQQLRRPGPRAAARARSISARPLAGSSSSSSRTRIAHPAHAFPLAAITAAVCFDAACQERADAAFLAAVSIPMAAALAAAWWVVQRSRPPKEAFQAGTVFEDAATGNVFGAPGDGPAVPERDSKGELVWRAISYTPWPVDASEGPQEGERIRIAVGKVRSRQPRTFLFPPLLPQPSDLVLVTLPRPLGVVFEYDAARKRAVVVDLVENSNADKLRRRAALAAPAAGAAAQAALPGDVLRAVTATNFVYPTKALFGAIPPERHIVLYGADRQTWTSVSAALRKGEAKDGEVTLVLERRRAAPAPAPPTDGLGGWATPVGTGSAAGEADSASV